MNEKNRFAFFNILFLSIGILLFLSFSLNSYAAQEATYIYSSGNGDLISFVNTFTISDNQRICVYWDGSHNNVYTNFYGSMIIRQTYTFVDSGETYTQSRDITIPNSNTISGYNDLYFINAPSGYFWGNREPVASVVNPMPCFHTLADAIDYLQTGYLPSRPFVEDMELDSFKVSTYEESFNSLVWQNVFKATWSDPRISTVQVIIEGTLKRDSFEGSSSPLKGSFNGNAYASVNGDVITLIATPFAFDGSYGPSLYYTFVFNSNDPLTNIWRKNHNYHFQDNTLKIPYTGVSGNDTYDAPVSGISQNTCYKIYYNPTTEEITNEYVYNVYYSPVVVYDLNVPSDVVEDTQDSIINNYTTNNYYTTTNQIEYNFDIDFGDISGSDVQDAYDDVGGFFNGLGSFLAKLVSLFQLLFPFLSEGIATFIVIAFGIIALLVIVALFIKVIGIIASLIP